MNPLQSILRQGARVLHSETLGGEEFTVAGVKFLARIEPADPVDYGLPLGDDSREQAVLHIVPGHNQDMPAITSQATVTQEDGQAWKVVKRVNSPVAATVQFYLVKL